MPQSSVLHLVGCVGIVLAVLLGGCGDQNNTTPLNCAGTIRNCDKVSVPQGATNCSQATCDQCSKKYQAFKDQEGAFCGIDCAAEEFKHCDVTSPPNRSATSCDEAGHLVCDTCSDGYESAVDTKTLEPLGTCSFQCTTAQVSSGCAPRSCSDASSCNLCRPGFVRSVPTARGEQSNSSNETAIRFLQPAEAATGTCTPAKEAVQLDFYMYRAQSDVTYPPENVDLASPAGVIFYLHDDVIARKQTCPSAGGRKFNISRVLRYKVTVMNTPQVFGHPPGGQQLGHFSQFDSGQCTEPTPEKCWDANFRDYGYQVGCQKQSFQQYYAPANEFPCFWYSLPGPCPTLPYNNPNKTKCAKQQPGGKCKHPSGTFDCTWSVDEEVAEVTVDELSGIKDFGAFCAAGNYEYDDKSDKGKGTDYWDGKHDPIRGGMRVQKLLRLFAEKYPTAESALELPDPACDGW